MFSKAGTDQQLPYSQSLILQPPNGGAEGGGQQAEQLLMSRIIVGIRLTLIPDHAGEQIMDKQQDARQAEKEKESSHFSNIRISARFSKKKGGLAATLPT